MNKHENDEASAFFLGFPFTVSHVQNFHPNLKIQVNKKIV